MKTIQYKTEHCYPDMIDLKGIVKKLNLTDAPKDIYQDFRCLYEWLRMVEHNCWTHSKHEAIAASELLEIAENFLERKFNAQAFHAALYCLRGYVAKKKTRNIKDFESMVFKFPSLYRIAELKPVWNEYIEKHAD